MENRTDAELMARYAGGCRGSFDELFRRYEGRAFRFLRHRIGSEERARDLYQELFLRLHRFRDHYDPAQPFAPWFFQIARNVVVDELRRSLRNPAIPLDDARTASVEPDSERRVAAREELDATLGALPRDVARLLVQAKGLGREYAELAAESGRSEAAVKQSASRSLRRLRMARAATR